MGEEKRKRLIRITEGEKEGKGARALLLIHLPGKGKSAGENVVHPRTKRKGGKVLLRVPERKKKEARKN